MDYLPSFFQNAFVHLDYIQCADAITWIACVYTAVMLGVMSIFFYISRIDEGGAKAAKTTKEPANELQTLAIALSNPTLPTEYADAGLSRLNLFELMQDYMAAEMHPNTHDLVVLMDILSAETVPETDSAAMHLYADASRWIFAALVVWSHSPKTPMPTWAGHSYVAYVPDNEDDEDDASEDDSSHDETDDVEATEEATEEAIPISA